MHVCVTKHHWLLALRFSGLAWGLLLGGFAGTTLERKKDGPGTFRVGISWNVRPSGSRSRASRSSQPGRQDGNSVNLEVAGTGAPRLPDCTHYLRIWTSRDLHSPGATFSVYLKSSSLISAKQPAVLEVGPELPVRFLFLSSQLQGSSAPQPLR